MSPQDAYKIAMSIGQDVGNRAMLKAGRSAWTLDDYNAACEATETMLRHYGYYMEAEQEEAA